MKIPSSNISFSGVLLKAKWGGGIEAKKRLDTTTPHVFVLSLDENTIYAKRREMGDASLGLLDGNVQSLCKSGNVDELIGSGYTEHDKSEHTTDEAIARIRASWAQR